MSLLILELIGSRHLRDSLRLDLTSRAVDWEQLLVVMLDEKRGNSDS